MPNPQSEIARGPLLIFQHFFGSSHREWREVSKLLEERHHCICIDAPGFGDAVHQDGFTVEEMAQRLMELLDSLANQPCILVGHSMTGKICMVVASRKPENLMGMVLVGPSPLVAEPVKEEDRTVMVDAQRSAETARAFFLKGAKRKLSEETIREGTEDVLRANATAWRRWPQSGSREDWSRTIETIDLPTLLVVGENDPAIPLPFQKEHTLPVLKNGRLAVVEGVGHLVPYEAPEELAALLSRFVLELVPKLT